MATGIYDIREVQDKVCWLLDAEIAMCTDEELHELNRHTLDRLVDCTVDAIIDHYPLVTVMYAAKEQILKVFSATKTENEYVYTEIHVLIRIRLAKEKLSQIRLTVPKVPFSLMAQC